MRVRILIVGEGSSDLPLIRLVPALAVAAGALRVEADARKFGHDPVERITAAARLDPSADILVVHRDADRPGLDARRRETTEAARQAGVPQLVVPCVPVRMTEAWLLLDEDEIRRVAGNPRGRVPLNLPPVGRSEEVPDPKAMLFEALVTAAEATGRRRRVAERSFDEWRRILLEDLDPQGPVARLPSFQVFQGELIEAVQRVLATRAE